MTGDCMITETWIRYEWYRHGYDMFDTWYDYGYDIMTYVMIWMMKIHEHDMRYKNTVVYKHLWEWWLWSELFGPGINVMLNEWSCLYMCN